VEGRPGAPITLPISTGPATGYGWQLELPEGVLRIADGPGRTLDPSVRMGGAEGGPLRVTAPSGEHLLGARLVRPWDPDDAIRVVRIRLHVH
jgi:predicted secreted protein